MTTHLSDALRSQVTKRAANKCEYCLILDTRSAKHHEVDHIYAEKHSAPTTLANLCLSCYYCNHYKGSDLCSLDPVTGDVVSLFHPRRDRWEDHFSISNARIIAKTAIGRVTVELLQMNNPDRVAEREILIRLGKYT